MERPSDTCPSGHHLDFDEFGPIALKLGNVYEAGETGSEKIDEERIALATHNVVNEMRREGVLSGVTGLAFLNALRDEINFDLW